MPSVHILLGAEMANTRDLCLPCPKKQGATSIAMLALPMGSAWTSWSPLRRSRNLAGLAAPFLCVSVVQPSAEPHGLRPVPWLVCQSCFIFWKSVVTWGFLCVTPARQLTFDPLCWVLHSYSVVFFAWQLCPFLKNIIFSFITTGEEAKLEEAKGKELFKCSQMHYSCQR